MNENATLDWQDARKKSETTGATVEEIQKKHEIDHLPNEQKSKGLIKSEAEVEKFKRGLSAAEFRHQQYVEEMQLFGGRQLQSVKLGGRISILTRQIGELAHGSNLLSERLAEHAGTSEHVHELLIIIDAIATNKHASEVLPALLSELETAKAQIDQEIAETAKRLGIKAD